MPQRHLVSRRAQQAWTAVKYPRAIWDDQLRCWVSDAQVAETGYTAFTSKKGQAITAWLTCAAIAHNLLRAAGSLASLAYGKAAAPPSAAT